MKLLVILGIAGVATAAVELFQVWSIREQKGYGDWAFMTAIGCGLVGAGLLVTAALVTLAGALL